MQDHNHLKIDITRSSTDFSKASRRVKTASFVIRKHR